MGLNCVKSVDPLSAVIPRATAIDISAIKESRLPIILVIGGTGAGKTTQAVRIAEHYGFCDIICRELLRDEVSTGSRRGIILAYFMSEGKSVPSDVLIELIVNKMQRNLDSAGFMLSGFPREKLQSKYFDRQIRPPDLVLYLRVRNSLLIDRILSRTITATGRQTRSIEQAWERIKHDDKMIKPILRHYKRRLVVIDGEKDELEVFEDICNAIDNVLKNLPPRVKVIHENK